MFPLPISLFPLNFKSIYCHKSVPGGEYYQYQQAKQQNMSGTNATSGGGSLAIFDQQFIQNEHILLVARNAMDKTLHNVHAL